MMSSMLVAFLAKLFLGLVALGLIFFALRIFDGSLGVNFKVWINTMEEENPKDLALYFGLRFIGICIFIGLIIG